MPKLPISICIIAKNAEKTISKTLASVVSLAEDVIVLDTGSDDLTPLLARNFGAKVYSHLWKYDFSEARNEAFKYARQPWLFCLDADEEIILIDFEAFEKKLFETNKTSFYINIENILNEVESSNLYRCRLLKASSNYLYSGRIHETPNIELDKTEYLSKEVIYIKHYGYNIEFANPAEKSQRNIEIIKKDTDYKNLYSWEKVYNAIALLKELNEISEKLDLLTLIENFINNKTQREIYENIVTLSFFHEAIQTYSKLKEIKKEESYCLKGLTVFETDLNLLAMAGECFYKQGNYSKSIEYYEKILALVATNSFMKEAYIYQGLKDYGTFYNLYLCYKALKNYAKAKFYLDKCLQIKPDFK